MKPANNYPRPLHRFTLVTALLTFCLVWIGGLVTSHEAGLTVPDWPTSYGYNMFLFPVSRWVGGIFYEHTHRLAASAVGFLTLVMAVWLWRVDKRAWVRWLGVIALVAVIIQGVLGGLRVTELNAQLGVFHGALAQLFFVLMSCLALCTSAWWHRTQPKATPAAGKIRVWYWGATAIIFVQLLLGATMRHEHAGLAITDFPLAYGQVWPDTSPEAIARYNQGRAAANLAAVTPFQIALQMVHRAGAILACTLVIFAAWKTRKGRLPYVLSRLATGWVVLLLIQFGLGATTILSGKSADIATAHVAVGSLALVTGALLIAISRRLSAPAPETADSPVMSPHPALP